MDTPHAKTAALITGSAQGLGLAIARQLVAEGCRRLVLCDRNAELGEAAAADLSQGGVEAHFLPVEMGDLASVAAMLASARARIGPVTALVNAAGNTDRGSILDTTPAQWEAIMNVNARGPFFLLQGFARGAIEAGIPASAVNILSIVVHGGLPFLAPYVASKAALAGITKNAAAALARHRIRVNGINVGWMDTPGEDAVQKKWHGRGQGWQSEAAAGLPFGALLSPESVAVQAAFLLGPRSGVVTGSVMDFDQQVIGAYPDTDAV